MTDSLSKRLDEIARNGEFSDALKEKLIDAAIAEHGRVEGAATDEARHAASFRRGRWSTPIWVALTGLITLSGNFLFDYMRAEQQSDITVEQALLDAENARTIALQNAEAERQLQSDKFQAEQAAQALAFQYDVIKSELEDLETAEERANSLRFLVRVGVLGKPLDLSEINKIIGEVAEGQTESLPPVGEKEAPAYVHDFSPCTDTTYIDKLDMGFVLAVRDRGFSTSQRPTPNTQTKLDALQTAFAENGVCAPRQIAAVISTIMYETAGFTQFAMAPEVATRLAERTPPSLRARLYPQDGDVVKYRSRGFIMLAGAPNYERYAQAVGRPELLENPDLLEHDPKLNAEVLTAALREFRIMNSCPPDTCTEVGFARRFLGTRPLTREFRAMFAEAMKLLED